MSKPASDRNLLVGVLALQLGFVSKDQLLSALASWLLHKDRPLEDLLREQKALSEDGWAKLQAVVQIHLAQHGGDPEKSLAAMSSVGSVREEIAALGDAGLEASLQQLSLAGGRKEEDGDPYRTIGGGQTTSEGVRFRILRPHAKGGLGEVSVALDSELNREVALKEIQSKFADVSESRARFMLEAQITGGLEHPGIVPVYGMGTYADGRPFYAMRFIRGDSLKDGVRKFFAKYAKTGAAEAGEDTAKTVKLPAAAYESLDFRQLLGRFVDVSNAVAYAHARGVLHRDLKPGNIMLGNYGETLVVDWGLAKATGHADDSYDTTQAPLTASTESGSAETRLGSALGTPGYMSPEQAAGRTNLFGPATDIYCLGATLYHLLTGRPPHLDNDDGNLLQRIQAGEFPRPRDLSPAIPAPLAAICLKAMATEQKDRYPTALSLAADIERFLADDPVTAHHETFVTKVRRTIKRHRTLAASIAVAVVATIVGLTAFAMVTSRTNRLLDTANIRLSDSNRELDQTNEKLKSANADLAASVKRVAETNQVLTKSLERESAATREAGDNLYSAHMNLVRIAWENAEIEKTRDLLLKHLPTQGGVDRRGFEWFYYWNEINSQYATIRGLTGEVTNLSYSHDGRWLAIATDQGGFLGRNAVYLFETASNKSPRMLKETKRWPRVRFSPNSPWLAIASGKDQGGDDLELTNIETGESHQLTTSTLRIPAFSFSSDGSKLSSVAIDSSNLLQENSRQGARGLLYKYLDGRKSELKLWDTKTFSSIDSPKSSLLSNRGLCAVSFLPKAELLLLGTQKGEVILWSGEDGIVSEWPGDGSVSPVQSISASPNGSFALIGTGSDVVGGRLYRCELNDKKIGAVQAISTPKGGVLGCAYSPSGELMASCGIDRTTTIWQYEKGAYNAYCTIRGHKQEVQALAFSPNGRYLTTGSWDGEVKFWALSRPPGSCEITSGSRDEGMADIPSSPLLYIFQKDGSKSIRRIEKATFVDSGNLSTGTVAIIGKRPAHLAPNAAAGKLIIHDLLQPNIPPLASISLGEDLKRQRILVSPDGKIAISYSMDGQSFWIRSHDASTGEKIGEYTSKEHGSAKEFFSAGPRVLKISPDSRRLLANNFVNQLCLWSLPSLELINLENLSKSNEFATGIAFSPDSRLLATDNRYGGIILWDGATLNRLATFSHDTPSPVELTFSPDGKLIAGGYRNGRIRVIQTDSGEERLSLHVNSRPIYHLEFSSDGKSLFTNSGLVCGLLGMEYDGKLDARLFSKPNESNPQYIPGAFVVPEDRWEQWHRNRSTQALLNLDWFAARFHSEKAALARENAARERLQNKPRQPVE